MRNQYRQLFVGTAVMSFLFLFLSSKVVGAADTETLQRLERLIQQQQAQIEAQAKAIEGLKQQVQKLSKPSDQMATEAGQVADKQENVVTNKSEKVSVKLYGQVNRAAMYTNDGNDDYFYHVDNDNSSTRIGILGNSKVNNDISAGAKIEVEFQANPSNEVTQVSQNGVPYYRMVPREERKTTPK